MEEVWKSIDDFENYMVSNYGRVKSIDRIIKENGKKGYFKKGVVLKGQPNKNNGRIYVNLYNTREKKIKNAIVARLVAKAFIDNPKNLREVNHIDRDVTNNHVDNLEWVSPKENMKHLENKYGFDFGRIPVIGKHKETGEEVYFSSIKNATDWLSEKQGKIAYASGISNCCKSTRKSYRGYKWESSLETIESID
jgi:hypothetical protein